MDCQTANVVGVSLQRGDLLARVVVEDAEVKVVRAADEPITSGDETHAAYGHFSHFERLDDRLPSGNVVGGSVGTREEGAGEQSTVALTPVSM